MTTERWTDEMLDILSTDIRTLTNLATQQQTSIGTLINLAAQQQADIRSLVNLAAQQQENMVLMQTQISTAQEEIRQIWRRLDIDTSTMKLAALPKEVIDDLCQDERWRLDIDPGFDSKHEFWMAWQHFIALPEEASALYEKNEEDLADFLNFDGFDVLLPVSRTHHPHIRLIRMIQSNDEKTLTLFLHDSFHQEWFKDARGARYGFLAVADCYQKHSCDFYLASYYHFSYLINDDYEAAKRIMAEKNNKLSE